MRTPIATLLERASVALPPQRPHRSNWSPYYPVVSQLVSNGHNVMEAVDWLIGQKEIDKADRMRAYRTLIAIHNRKTAND